MYELAIDEEVLLLRFQEVVDEKVVESPRVGVFAGGLRGHGSIAELAIKEEVAGHRLLLNASFVDDFELQLTQAQPSRVCGSSVYLRRSGYDASLGARYRERTGRSPLVHRWRITADKRCRTRPCTNDGVQRRTGCWTSTAGFDNGVRSVGREKRVLTMAYDDGVQRRTICWRREAGFDDSVQ